MKEVDVATKQRGTALALSGGGFRATLFHLGSLIRLNQLGWLAKLDAVSSVSGGSIVGAFLGMKWLHLEFKDGRATNLHHEVIEPIRELCRHNIDLWPSLVNMVINLWGGTSNLLRNSYAYYLYNDATLADLPEPNAGPRFIITGSNLQTGSLVRFEHQAVTDPRLGYLEQSQIPLADVVAVSTAYPPFLSPVVLKTDAAQWQSTECADLSADRSLKAQMVLTDGGMHDPLALSPIWRDYYTLLISDASHTREVWRRPSSYWMRQLNRTTLMQTFANSAVQREVINEVFKPIDGVRIRRGSYWANDDRLADSALPQQSGNASPLLTDSEETRALSSLRTRLNKFDESEQVTLINWGYALCDASLRTSFSLPDDPPAQLPYK